MLPNYAPAAVTPYLLDCVRKDVGDAALQANIAPA